MSNDFENIKRRRIGGRILQQLKLIINCQAMYTYVKLREKRMIYDSKSSGTEAESLEANEITSNEIILEIYLEWAIRWLLRDTRYALCTRN